MRPSGPQSKLPSLAWAGMLSLLALAVVGGLAWTVLSLRQAGEGSTPTTPNPAPSAKAEQTADDGELRPNEAGEVLLMGNESRQSMAAGIATAVALTSQGAAGALTELALIKTDPGSLFWAAAEDPDAVLSLRADLLRRVRDYDRVGTWWRNEGEAMAYCDALVKASRTPAAIFEKNARRDVTFAHLFEEPAKYRGDVVHIRGRLRLVSRYDPPIMAAQAGVRDLYECWIFDDRYAAAPWCVLLTELPPAIKATGKVDREVAFDGYFFKRYRYKAQDSVKANQFRDAPLLIGKTVTLLAPPAETAAREWPVSPLSVVLSLFGAIVAVGAGLTWWYRREDWRIRERLRAVCRGEFVEPSADPMPPVALPVGPAVSGIQSSGSEATRHTYGHGHDKVRAVHRALGQGGIDSS